MKASFTPLGESERVPPDALQPSSGMVYDSGFPYGVTAPDVLVTTQADPIMTTKRDTVDPDVNISRYIDQSVGGQTGVVHDNGYTGGISRAWYAARFTGRSVRFFMRPLQKDTGPVGLDNRNNVLQAGVREQFSTPPSLEQIYQAFTHQG